MGRNIRIKDLPEYMGLDDRISALEDARTIHYTSTISCLVEDPTKKDLRDLDGPAVQFPKPKKLWWDKAEVDAKIRFEKEQQSFLDHLLFTKIPCSDSVNVNKDRLQRLLSWEESKKKTIENIIAKGLLNEHAVIKYTERVSCCKEKIRLFKEFLNG